MSEETTQAKMSLPSLITSLPGWARIVLPAIFLAECAVLAAGLARSGNGETGVVRFDLPSSRPAPGFSTL